jgi:hypothetical protein
MSENSVQFLPFHAINEFMRADFRLGVVRSTLSALPRLPKSLQDGVNHWVKAAVKIPGFRNSEKAPAMVKVIPTAKAFENNPALVAAILAAWAEAHTELRAQVFEVLKSRGWFFFPSEINLSDLPQLNGEEDWGILPLEADRTRLPGFLTYWPDGQEFEALYDTFSQMFPDASGSLDEISLMAVWLANRLPYHIRGQEESAAAESSASEAD